MENQGFDPHIKFERLLLNEYHHAINLIDSKANVMMGKPVIAGTRITVECILESLGAGETIEQIVAEHPRLTQESVLAAVQFAARALRADVTEDSASRLSERMERESGYQLAQENFLSRQAVSLQQERQP